MANDKPFTVRKQFQRAREGTRHPSFPEALEARPAKNPEEYFIEWSGINELCVLDVDWHHSEGPNETGLYTLVNSIEPVPWYWWVSRSGGLHLVYENHIMAAKEYAAMGALGVLTRDSQATVELLPRTRFPEGQVHEADQSIDTGFLKGWLDRGGVDQTIVEQWLADKGLKIGSRASHRHCPKDPRDNQSGGLPVRILEDGVQCFVCDTVIPWAKIVGHDSVNRIALLARHFVQYSNAKPTLESIWGQRISPSALRSLYSACLQVMHNPEDPRVRRCFKPFPYIQGEGSVWLNEHTLEATALRDKAPMRSLPSTQWARVDENGEWKTGVDEVKLSTHCTAGQKPPGYPEHKPINGIRLWGQFNEYDDSKVRIVRPTRQYQEPKNRMPIEQAWDLVYKSFPGIDRAYLTLLLVARGFAESNQGPVPQILVTGPSGSAKSGTVRVAAEFLGDRCKGMSYVREAISRFREAIGEAAAEGTGFLAIDEFCKGQSAPMTLQAFTPLLMDRDFTYRKNYLGPTEATVCSVIVVTNTSFPGVVYNDKQIGRRFMRVNLTSKVPNWQETAIDYDGWATRKTDHLAAVNAILSDIIDTYFSGVQDTFLQVAHALGFQTLSEYAEESEGMGCDDLIKDLFDATCHAPEPAGTRWRGRGWKLVTRDGMDDLTQAWEALADNKGDGFWTSRRISETDLGQVLGVSGPVVFEMSDRQNTAALRFHNGMNPRASGFKVNEELIDGGDSGDSGPGDVDGLGPERPDPEVQGVVGPEMEEVTYGVGLDLGFLGSRDSGAVATGGPVEYTETVSQINGIHVPFTDPRQVAPQDLMFVDLETRSARNLKECDGHQYAADQTTEILCACFIPGTMDAVYVWSPVVGDLDPTDLWPPESVFSKLPVHIVTDPGDLVRDKVLVAHNAVGFDAHVWREKVSQQPRAWLDSMHLGRLKALPGGLDQVGQYLWGQGKVGADMKRLCKPLKNGAFIPLTFRNAVPLIQYCVQDTLIMAHTWFKEQVAHVPSHEVPMLAVDREINCRGIRFDVDLAKKIIDLGHEFDKNRAQYIEDVTNGEIKGKDLNRTGFLLEWFKERGLGLPNLTKDTIEQVLAGTWGDGDEDQGAIDSVDPVAFKVLGARQEQAKITTPKLVRALKHTDDENRIRFILAYGAAHTLRWGGRNFQPQNLPRPVDFGMDPLELIDRIKGDETIDWGSIAPQDALSSLIRLCLIPSNPDEVFAIADLGQIEARALAWLSGESKILNAFATGQDIYKLFAVKLFGVPLEQVTKQQRFAAKVAVLGLGYNMGSRGFARYAASNGLDLESMGLTPEEVVNAYRDANQKIAGRPDSVMENGCVVRKGGIWKKYARKAMQAVENPGRRYKHGPVTWTHDGQHLVCELPSGRPLVYRDAAIEQRVPGYCDLLGLEPTPKDTLVYRHPRYGRIGTYGGKLVENVTQAACRDIMASILVRSHQAGLSTVLHVHDEIIVEAHEKDASEVLDTLGRIMVTPDEWYNEIPLAAEGFCAPRYMKAYGKEVSWTTE